MRSWNFKEFSDTLNPTQEFKAVTGTLQIANIFVGTPTPICDDAEPD